MQKIIPCLWFDGQAEEAANFYTALFPGSKTGSVTRFGKEGFEAHGQAEGTVMTVDFDLAGYQVLGLNGGAQFKFNPAISFSVLCATETELDELWEKLAEDGKVLMELGRYEWAEKYGWVADKYGLTWQLTLVNADQIPQRITPCFLFVGDRYGRAEEALEHYVSVFEDSRKENVFHRQDNEGSTE